MLTKRNIPCGQVVDTTRFSLELPFVPHRGRTINVKSRGNARTSSDQQLTIVRY